MNNLTVFDIETDGINATKIHCLVYATKVGDYWERTILTDYDEMRVFLLSDRVLIGHFITLFDIPTLERILDIKIVNRRVDTLTLSWYLYPTRNKHGLEVWGENFGVKKPEIQDWENQTQEDYINRCSEDVKINWMLWEKQIKDLNYIYETPTEAWRLINYLTFKMECAREAVENPFRLNVERCKISLKEMETLSEEKLRILSKAMPSVEVKSKIKKPTTLYKKDGGLSVAGKRWVDKLKELSLPEDYEEEIEFVSGYSEPNPNSNSQIKDWLFSLGWKPRTFSYINKIDDSGKKYVDSIPQVRKEIGGEKVLCDSVKELIGIEPALEELGGLTVLSHRIGYLKGFLSSVDDNGNIKSEIHGLTNTLRFRHKTIVNLPSINKPYGDVVRGVLMAQEGYTLCGSDMSSLEDRTKQHYMWDYDPDYVREMLTDDFDPHLALAEFAGALTPEQVKFHKEGVEDYSVIRHQYKTGNYSCTYGAGGKKVALTLGIPESEGHKIVDAYRQKNWSLDSISQNCTTKKVYGQEWLYNPVSRFWYSLRHTKDRFSTLNQGTGVYVFDMWIHYLRSKNVRLTLQYHDEIVTQVKDEELTTKILKWAINKVNDKLKLNRDMDISIQFGENYSKIH